MQNPNWKKISINTNYSVSDSGLVRNDKHNRPVNMDSEGKVTLSNK